MFSFSSAFRSDVIIASFDNVIQTQAAHGRTDALRSAIAAQFGVVLPSGKTAFLNYWVGMVKSHNDGTAHDLKIKGYKNRAALWAAIEQVCNILKNPENPETVAPDAWLGEFAPKRKEKTASADTPAPAPAPTADTPAPAPAPTADTPVPAVDPDTALSIVLASIQAGTYQAAQLAALRHALQHANEPALV